jgi:hypothetical protein
MERERIAPSRTSSKRPAPSAGILSTSPLLKAYQENLITEETALICCTHKNKMGRDIDMTKKLLNADFAGSSGLKIAPVPQQSAPPPVPGIPAFKK